MARASAGIAAPLIVMIVLLIQGMTTPDYDPVRQTISELGTGWGGTRIVSLYGLALMLVVWGPIAKALARKMSTVVLVSSLLVIGMGCVGLGETAAESGAWSSMGLRGRLHLVFAFAFVFAAIPVACLAAWRALPDAWRVLRAYSVFTGLVCLLLFSGTLIAIGGSRPDASTVARLGLIERAYVFAFLIWQCIVSASLPRSRKLAP